MYETNLFNIPPNAINGRLIGGDVVEQAKALNAGQINRAVMPSVNTNGIGVSTNEAYQIQMGSTNEYLIDQKFRNSGLYTKMKNKTIYSAGSLEHASLNRL